MEIITYKFVKHFGLKKKTLEKKSTFGKYEVFLNSFLLPLLSFTASQIHSQQSPKGQFNFTSHFKWQSLETWTHMCISCPKYFMLSQIRNNQQQLQMSVVRETEMWAPLLLTGVWLLCGGYWEMCYQVAMPVTSMSWSVNPLLLWWKPDGISLVFFSEGG